MLPLINSNNVSPRSPSVFPTRAFILLIRPLIPLHTFQWMRNDSFTIVKNKQADRFLR